MRRKYSFAKISSKWGAHPEPFRISALALCFSMAGYACPVWGRSVSRSVHAKQTYRSEMTMAWKKKNRRRAGLKTVNRP